jgi:hypothetical protein
MNRTSAVETSTQAVDPESMCTLPLVERSERELSSAPCPGGFPVVSGV